MMNFLLDVIVMLMIFVECLIGKLNLLVMEVLDLFFFLFILNIRIVFLLVNVVINVLKYSKLCFIISIISDIWIEMIDDLFK